MTISRAAAVVASVAAALPGALPSVATAQLRASAGAGAGALGYRRVLPSASAGVADADVRYDAPYGAVAARGRLARFEDDSGSAEGSLLAALRRPAGARGVGVGAAVEGSATRYRGFAPSRRLDVTLGPTFAAGPYEGALRAHLARLSLDDDARGGVGGELLVQRRHRSARVTLSVSGLQFDDRALGWHDTTYYVAGFPFRSRYQALDDVRRSYVDVEAGVHLPVRRAVVALTVGARGGSRPTDPGGWVHVQGALPLSPSTSLVAEFGRLPSVPEQNLPSAPFATVALRFTPFAGRRPGVIPVARPGVARGGGGPRFALVGVDAAGARVVRLSGVSASRVEIMGDFTDWSPLPLAPAGPGVWEAAVRVRPGTHRVVLRLDGGPWRPPPELPVAADEFRGSAGVLLVE